MAQFIVRDIEESVKNRLRKRAKAHGRSMEAEIRDILRSAAATEIVSERGLGTRIAKRFEDIGLDQPIAELRDWQARIPDFK